MRKASLVAAILLVAGCSSDNLHRLPYDLAKGACKGSSKCTLEQNPTPRGGAEPAPDHWYEDGYGRDERAPRH